MKKDNCDKDILKMKLGYNFTIKMTFLIVFSIITITLIIGLFFGKEGIFNFLVGVVGMFLGLGALLTFSQGD